MRGARRLAALLGTKQPRRLTSRRAVTFVLLTMLCSCSGFEPLATPDQSAPKVFVEGASGPTAALRTNWPSVFGSTELTQLVADANIANLDIAIAVSRIAQAEAQAGISAAALYPTVSGTADATASGTPGTLAGVGSPSHENYSRQYSLGLTASYALDIWGKNAATLEAARQTAIQARFQRDATALTTVAAVANAYFNILAAQDRLRIARDNVKSADRILNAIKGRLSVGTATQLDVAQQESVVATQRASVPPLEQTVLQGRSTLAVLIGRAPEQLTIKGGSLDTLRSPMIPPGIPSQLLQRRPDIAVAEAGLLSGKANVAAARAAFFPSLDLTAQAGFETTALKALISPDAEFYSIAANLAQPIFDGYNLQNQLEFQRSKYAELLQTYRKAIISAFSDVDTALVAVRKTREHERLQTVVVDASRRAYMITDERLKEGTIDIVTLLQTQSTLFQAQDQLVQVRLERFQAAVSLYQALGGGWTRDDLATAMTNEGKTP
jgi:NodT family efflux transporter outer membrane factor (OMF) lipoprotein